MEFISGIKAEKVSLKKCSPEMQMDIVSKIRPYSDEPFLSLLLSLGRINGIWNL